MWIAQHPCGTWCAYKEKPREKMGGWDGEVYAKLDISGWILSWRQTLKEMSFKEYQDKYRHKEVR
ncbi:putative cytidine and deoxycytidylate deaminase [Pseudomonas phage PPSC2]|uniref:Putative cytidine and deoxycytidylate deaminase n=1 Tax=Pseudomonas phage PPSC2 TaxID=2041350 RepID=A0A2R2YB96_9CAUD|nr:putative cytidine and deoxycytidylate deaminase [Pseudomonas phage PPSC2]ATN92919.1 putative cytidine and deoxycytidylate deaminase [Pseudomonas phage PPSC2]